MTRFSLSAKDRRAAVLGVIVVGSLVAMSKGLPALADWEGMRVAEAADAITRATSASANVRMLAVLRDSLRSRRMQLAAIDSTMITGTSAAAAAANLASSLDEIAVVSKLKVGTMQLRADTAAAGSIARVGVRVTATSDVRGLAAFLRSVEGNDMPLVVRDLFVSQPEPAAPESRAEALRIDVLVEAIARIAAERQT
jgi:hypothetical protein